MSSACPGWGWERTDDKRPRGSQPRGPLKAREGLARKEIHMPKRVQKQGKRRSLFEAIDDALEAAEETAMRVVDGAAQRLGAELERGAGQLAEHISRGASKTSGGKEACQCEGHVYFGPDGLCQECGLPEETAT